VRPTITRREWGARHGAGNATSGAKLHAFLHHSATSRPPCGATLEELHAEIRRIEAYHARHLTPTNPRIGYTHGSDPAGRRFEGTGWGRIGAHTKDRNSSSYGYVLLLDSDTDKPTAAQIEDVGAWRAEGVALGHLHPRHSLLGHRDAVATACPGRHAYEMIVRAGSMPAPVPTPSPIGPAAVLPRPSLRKGSGGGGAPADIREAVRELQRRLGLPARYQTGYFWIQTDGAVRDLQRRHGLKADGIVGPKTWAILGA
jgi:hypothetical protein